MIFEDILLLGSKKKQIYCWDGEWKVFKEEELLKIISKIQKKVMNLYSEWSKKNSRHFTKYMSIILG